MKSKITVLCMFLALLLLGGCSGSDAGPKKVVKDYLNAIEKGDAKEALSYVVDSYMSPEEKAFVETLCTEAINRGYTVKDAKIISVEMGAGDSTAVVKASVQVRAMEKTEFEANQIDVPVVKENGKWKLESVI